jgi:hypothetical protein
VTARKRDLTPAEATRRREAACGLARRRVRYCLRVTVTEAARARQRPQCHGRLSNSTLPLSYSTQSGEADVDSRRGGGGPGRINGVGLG